MDKRKLIQDFIKVCNVEFNQWDVLENLKTKGRTIIKIVFGESSSYSQDYIKDLEKIKFWSGVAIGNGDDSFDREIWNREINKMRGLFAVMLEHLDLFEPIKDQNQGNEKSKLSKNKIFIVHGHDDGMKDTVARLLEKQEIEAIILHEKPTKGSQTIIEKIEDYSDVQAAIILLSPDDKGCETKDFPDKAQSRARQNVIFELGYFMGKLGRERVFSLYKAVDDFEKLTDYEGVVYIPFDNKGAWRYELANGLNTCGFYIDKNKL